MNDVIANGLGGVLTAAVIAVGVVAWRKAKQGAGWTGRWAGLRLEGRRHTKRLQEYERCIAEKSQGGKRRIPVSRSGYSPVVVTYSDGSRASYFDGNSEAYRNYMLSGFADLSNTFLGRAPECPCGSKPTPSR